MATGNKPSGLGALAQRFIICNLAVQRADEALAEAKEARTTAEEAMLSALAEAGVESVKYKGFTAHIVSQLFASLINHDGEQPKAKAMAALKANDLGWMVKDNVSASTLAAWVREQDIDKATSMPKLPEALVAFIKVSKKFGIRVKKSS